MYDLIIRNGSILDGTGSPSFHADIGIRNGKIVKIGKNLSGVQETLDAAGLTVTPGFIDSHSHADTSLLSFPDQIEKVEQGITTAIGGNCGGSAAPGNAFPTMGAFLDAVKQIPLGSNHATFVGHGTIRHAVMGSENRIPTREELAKMGELLREAIAHGALGVSFGLIYAPGSFAGTDELIYMATEAAKCGGMVSAHIRDEGYQLYRSCEEFIRVIKASGARGVLSHHKAMYRDNWGKVHHTLQMLDRANDEGFDIYCDTYPYTASHTSLYARFIPKEYVAGGNEVLLKNLSDPSSRDTIRKINTEKFGSNDDLSWCLVVSGNNLAEYVGLRLNEIAALRKQDVYDTICDLIIQSNNTCHCCFFLMCEDDLKTVMAHPRCMICTDSGVRGNSTAYHPRLRGSFPRALGRYVRDWGVVSLPEMIRKMTAMPAAVYGLTSKGLLKEGFDADICIFDPNRISDRAGFTSCHERAEGLRWVLVGGQVAVEDSRYTGVKAGCILL